MKALAHRHIWWKGLDKDLEKQSLAKSPLHPWTWPDHPWQRLHVDFADPFLNQFFLIVVDAHSKWAEVVEMTHTTTAKIIAALRHC